MEFVFDQTDTYKRNQTTDRRAPVWSSSGHESSAPRKALPSSISDVEIAPTPKRRRKKTAEVSYLKNAKTPRKKRLTTRKFQLTWAKFCWLIVALVMVRLVFMDRGVVDYYEMKEVITQKEHELQLLKQENISLVQEIHNIKVNPVVQKRMARTHLGVIAKDEYLVLFASDSSL